MVPPPPKKKTGSSHLNKTFTRAIDLFGQLNVVPSRPFPSSPGPLFQKEGRCSAFDIKIIFQTHFHRKGCAPSLILKVRVFGTRVSEVAYSNLPGLRSFFFGTCIIIWKFMTKTFYSERVWIGLNTELRYGKTDNKKRATCVATLLQNELNSDVARFTNHIKPVLQQIRLLTGLNTGGKTCNIAVQLVLQSRIGLFPSVSTVLKSENNSYTCK